VFDLLCVASLTLLPRKNFFLGKGGDEYLEKEEKAKLVAEMSERLKKAQATFVVEYQGLNVEAITRVRTELRKKHAEFQVVKNRLLKIAARDTGTEAIKDHLVGPCAIAITYDDVVAPAKVLVEQSKKLEKLKIRIGQIGGKAIDLEAIKRLSELPGREVLLARTLAAMQAVPASFVRALNGVIVNLLNVLKAVEKQKQGQGN
jgi:large subunit ribosomal protein L10